MDRRAQYDLAIVGGGIVGATLAAALSHTPLRIILVDAQAPPRFDVDQYALRVSAIGRAADQVFDGVGVWDAMRHRRVSPYRHMQAWDSGGSGQIEFHSAEIGQACLGHIIENDVMVDALHERIAQASNVEFLAPAKLESLVVSAGEVVLAISGRAPITARLVVGADGAQSRIRELANISSRARSYSQTALVAHVGTSSGHRETAWQRFLPTGPLAFLPLADGRSSIVWSCDQARAEQLLAMTDAQFQIELGKAFEHRLGEITSVSERKAFPLALAHAEHYVGPRVALVGDAAHLAHPLAGQGANLGLMDAASLAEVLWDAHGDGKDIGALSVLRRYERWRKGENALMLAVMDGFKKSFGTDNPVLSAARNLALNVVDAAVPLKNIIVRRAMGLEGDLPRLARGQPLV